MSFLSEVKKTVNRVYTDVYLKRRYADGSFDTDWIDITRWVETRGLGCITFALDSGNFDVGLFVANNVQVIFDNSTGKFNDNTDSRSYWAAFESRDLSKIKIEAGYITDDDERLPATPFNGILDERSMRFSQDDTVRATILSLESILKSTYVVAGALSSAVTVKDAIFILCNRGEVTRYIGVSEANINPSLDVTIDNSSDYDGKKLDLVMNEILLYANSVMYVDGNGDMIVTGRNNTNDVKYRFFANSHDASAGARDNVYSVTNFNNGRQRVKNAWYWSGTSLSALSLSRYLTRYGVTRRSFSTGAITNTATRQAILDNLLNEFQFPKRELSLTTDYMPGVLNFFDTVTVDIKPNLSRNDNVPIAGHAIAGTAVSIDYISGLLIDPLLGFKIIAIQHDLGRGTTTFKLREKGTALNDGYLHVMLSKTYTVSFAGTSTEDIDVSGEGINAQRSDVSVLDVSRDYADDFISVTRPDANTVRLTAGGNITDTFRVLVVEAEE